VASWEEAVWDPQWTAPTRDNRRGGRYKRYAADTLCDRSLQLPRDVSELARRVEAEVRGLGDRPGSRGLEGLARFLLRSEAIASSRIEGLEVSPQQVGLAELIAEENIAVRGANTTAKRVAANIAAVRQATLGFARAESVTVEGITDLQRVLTADQPDLQDLRRVQNWIGGSSFHPFGAEFVPPDPGLVPALMEDLASYMNGGEHSALVQAGLVHAQFETIHPYKDGNGRVGRALIHSVLVRRGLTRTAILPISPVLLTRSQEYVEGLSSYRYEGQPESAEAMESSAAWLRVFLTAVSTAVTLAADFARQLDELRLAWERAVAHSRRAKGVRDTPRADSATARILASLQENPVLTTATVARLFNVSSISAKQALDELAEAGILRVRRLDGKTHSYLAMDVFDLLALAERRLASTRWDTRDSPPHRATPFLPAGEPGR
jgi:Fic family protein